MIFRTLFLSRLCRSSRSPARDVQSSAGQAASASLSPVPLRKVRDERVMWCEGVCQCGAGPSDPREIGRHGGSGGTEDLAARRIGRHGGSGDTEDRATRRIGRHGGSGGTVAERRGSRRRRRADRDLPPRSGRLTITAPGWSAPRPGVRTPPARPNPWAEPPG